MKLALEYLPLPMPYQKIADACAYVSKFSFADILEDTLNQSHITNPHSCFCSAIVKKEYAIFCIFRNTLKEAFKPEAASADKALSKLEEVAAILKITYENLIELEKCYSAKKIENFNTEQFQIKIRAYMNSRMLGFKPLPKICNNEARSADLPYPDTYEPLILKVRRALQWLAIALYKQDLQDAIKIKQEKKCLGWCWSTCSDQITYDDVEDVIFSRAQTKNYGTFTS